MRDLQIPHIPADLLDHLVMDTCELERLAERLIQSLDSAELKAVPRGRLAVQLMDLLSRMDDASCALNRVAGHQFKSVASALAADRADSQRSVTRVREPTSGPHARRRP